MKRTLTAIAAASAIFAGAASADTLTPASETLVYNLNGFVQSQCELTPNGEQSRKIVMTQGPAQGITQINFSCNSPYKVTVVSENGGMEHEQSGIVIPYQLRHGGSIGDEPTNYGPYYDSSELTTEKELDRSGDWLSIQSNRGKRQLNLDVLFNDDTYAVAGNYYDKLTVVVAADF